MLVWCRKAVRYMLALAHMGITLAAAVGLEKVLARRGHNISGRLDYRLVLVGSMLPDIIDKPLGGLILRESLGNGRIYSHTLLFLLLLWGLGYFFRYRFRRPGGLVLAGGSLVHCVLDGMWLFPGTLLWPAYGWSFPKGHPENWLQLWFNNLVHNPLVYVPEFVGGVVLLYFAIRVITWRGLKNFMETGRCSA